MTFLTPWALLWLGSLPVLVWLWRLAATHRQLQIPSLIPFEHLLKRPPRRRSRLVVNPLFWLQLAALTLLAATLAQPVMFQRRARTVLVVADTSASLGARSKGSSAFEHARRLLRGRLARKARAEQWLIVASAPVTALTAQPTSDPTRLRDVIDTLQVNDVGGNVGTAAHLGGALLGGEVDHTLVVTDEHRPTPAPADDVDPPTFTGGGVEFLTVGGALPNVAFIGLDAHGPLCRQAAPSLLATVQNFSDQPSRIRLVARQRGRLLAETSAVLEPRARTSLPLTITEAADEWVEVGLEADRDALAVDNRAHVRIPAALTVPVAVVSDDPEFRRVIGRWLGACEGLVWSDAVAPTPLPSLVVTDRPAGDTSGLADAVGILRFTRSPSPHAAVAHWTVDADHPVAAYLPTVVPVAASLGTTWSSAAVGEPVVWGLVRGERLPLVLVGEQEGRREVSCLIDPTVSPDSISLLLIFFNSLRWLMGQVDVATSGEPLLIPSLPSGMVVVRRPDGAVERLGHDGGTFRYDAATRAGVYRFTSGRQQVTRAVNFFDPLESDLLHRASTWRPLPRGEGTRPSERRLPWPLTQALTLFVLLLLLVEWRLSCRKRP